jgi:hypothetical protein
MRKDGLTTAKMLAIAQHLCFNRKLRLRDDQKDEMTGLQRDIDTFKKVIQSGISKAEFIDGMQKLGYKGVEYLMGKNGALEFYNEEHKYIFPDRAKEDDGSSSNIEHAEEIGFVGLRQLEAEERVEREKDEGKAAAE